MKARLIFWSLVSALAGFLFGFDTVVISGAEQTIQKLWGLSDAMHGFAMGSALYGMVVGSLLGGWPADRFGRKPALIGIGVLFTISAVGCAFAPGVWWLIAARFIGGLGIGSSTVAAPMYIAEISPPDRRGRLAGMFQFNIVFGIVVAYASNALLARTGDDAWRWMLGVAAFPSAIYTVCCFALPESPRWLIARKGDRAGGMNVLRLIDPDAPVARIEAAAEGMLADATAHDTSARFWTPRLRQPILLAILVAFFNQLSGINAVLYFAPRIFELTGLGDRAAMLQSIGVGVTNLVFTFVGLGLIDRLGRRTLLWIGGWGYVVSLGLTAWVFFTQHYTIVPYCLFAFIASHAVGQGAVIWVFISEIFPNRFRAEGQTLGCGTHWVFAALLTTVFPIAARNIPAGYIFLFFCGMMVLELVWIKTMVPETKGVPLEQMQERLGVRLDEADGRS